jgi:hypothetical protein
VSADLVKRLRDACVGHPHAVIPWPHRLLHEAADRLRDIESDRDRLVDVVHRLQGEISRLKAAADIPTDHEDQMHRKITGEVYGIDGQG